MNAAYRLSYLLFMIVDRKQFIRMAGGVFTSRGYGGRWGKKREYDYFWDFFAQKRWRKVVKAIYSDVTIDVLLRNNKYSVEHLIPKSFLVDYLRQRKRSRSLIDGALNNPLNFAPSHRTVNSHRSSWPFDFDNDSISFRHQVADGAEYGFDIERQWVVPERSRGYIGRAAVYMCILYDLHQDSVHSLEDYLSWAVDYPPQMWERAFNCWVYRKYKINNPLLSHPGLQLTEGVFACD